MEEQEQEQEQEEDDEEKDQEEQEALEGVCGRGALSCLEDSLGLCSVGFLTRPRRLRLSLLRLRRRHLPTVTLSPAGNGTQVRAAWVSGGRAYFGEGGGARLRHDRPELRRRRRHRRLPAPPEPLLHVPLHRSADRLQPLSRGGRFGLEGDQPALAALELGAHLVLLVDHALHLQHVVVRLQTTAPRPTASEAPT